ncbi:hypothetical protein P175DRAFT_0527960 [Aspergillus ochraceoroseus IBT 24754]|uniref:Tse2 ADP-ribosyltransferase toxin domain-containing protein n=2 Tax=Aspergillus ochraceoroseus TaxID=138278 RepID=A0A2T5M7I0_9EURO|nr:uncharacterized protein P175DRAFT_0527960 [Aspergillus ochraceoroseus IBT 24754]KKK22680.1 hypothetical protein AOCH_001130 [Aspergillus ochraceoroseus]PTU24484.1 hypothetical protein P175DRAFT_0527960 [Aspergillus ochraceoroseus IBT 24754]
MANQFRDKTWRYRNVFVYFPKELFRIDDGPRIQVKVKSRYRRSGRGIEILSDRYGYVRPKALNPLTYQFPNGLSVHPNTARQQTFIKNYSGEALHIYSIPAGTMLPEKLLLVHDAEDHYSIQPRRHMRLREFHDTLIELFRRSSKCFTQDEWLAAYPEPTDQDDLKSY